MLAAPGPPPAGSGSRMATLHSRAAALALARIANRARASQSVVILAAVATLLGLRTVNDRCLITPLCANRFPPASRDYVGTIAQDALTAPDPRPLLFDFEVLGLTRHDVGLSVWADQGRFPAAEVEDFLFAVERLLVAAESRDVPARDIGELAGISPVPRDASWRRIDSCWIEMPAVQQLLDDVAASVPGIQAAQAFCTRVVASARAAESLVAYVSAPGNQITPQLLHAQCRQRLPAGLTGMAPAWYVICDQAPHDPARLESWRHLPARAEGSGRA